MRIHFLQHVSFENLANIEKWAKSKNFPVSKTLLYENTEFPDINSFDLLVILGGPMNIYEEEKFGWLKEEKEFINQAIKQDKYILGICLGAQLLADCLGARVYQNNHKEIGFFPIELSDETANLSLFKGFPQVLDVFHWHGDAFDLPENSVLIASSEACANQGFIYNDKIIGLQFHLEASKASVDSLIANCKDEITLGDYVQTAEQMTEFNKLEELENRLNIFLDNIEKIITKGEKSCT